mmetsp:Transcript_71095/g.201502  ORF Transcript_71095/g.201502 Transcript_71095/m.201502 type:complete len:341 (-) Transcript_71095:141-1163(-)
MPFLQNKMRVTRGDSSELIGRAADKRRPSLTSNGSRSESSGSSALPRRPSISSSSSQMSLLKAQAPGHIVFNGSSEQSTMMIRLDQEVLRDRQHGEELLLDLRRCVKTWKVQVKFKESVPAVVFEGTREALKSHVGDIRKIIAFHFPSTFPMDSCEDEWGIDGRGACAAPGSTIRQDRRPSKPCCTTQPAEEDASGATMCMDIPPHCMRPSDMRRLAAELRELARHLGVEAVMPKSDSRVFITGARGAIRASWSEMEAIVQKHTQRSQNPESSGLGRTASGLVGRLFSSSDIVVRTDSGASKRSGGVLQVPRESTSSTTTSSGSSSSGLTRSSTSLASNW